MAKNNSPETSTSSTEQRISLVDRLKRPIAIAAAVLVMAGQNPDSADSRQAEAIPSPKSDKTELPSDGSMHADIESMVTTEQQYSAHDDVRNILPSFIDVKKYELPSTETVTEKIKLKDPMVLAESFGINNPEKEIRAISEKAISEFAKIIAKEVKYKGYTMRSFRIGAGASDESVQDTVDHNPGLNKNNDANEDLADLRIEYGEKELKENLEKQLGVDSESLDKLIIIEDGVEIHDEELNKEIFKLAEELNINADDLVIMFNNGVKLPRKAEKILKGLKDGRFIKITATLVKVVEIKQPSGPGVTPKKVEEEKEITIIVPKEYPRHETVLDTDVEEYTKTRKRDPKDRNVKVNPGYGRVPKRDNRPATAGFSIEKGSGGRVATMVKTTHSRE